jgi:hypothetical protein
VTVNDAVTVNMAFAPAFAMSGLEGSVTTAVAPWRSAMAAGAISVPANHSIKPAATQTQLKHYVVTTPDAGRGNKGTSPWRFPV